ncbi:MAG: chloride channel protein [Candidatus Omnitrophota bacterium]
MRKRINEESAILYTVFKWLLLSIATGLIVGAATAIFLRILNWSTAKAATFDYYFLFFPVSMVVSALLVKYLAPDAEGHGTEKVIEAVHKRSGHIPLRVVPVKLAATVITLASGGSAGKEGPCAQIGGGLASYLSGLLRLDDYDRKKLVICGISAGFASVFGTPIAGAIFGVEVLYAGSILYDVLLPSFICGIISYHVTSFLGIQYLYHPVNIVPIFGPWIFLQVVAAGIFFGITAFLLIEMLTYVKKFSSGLRLGEAGKAFLGGLCVSLPALFFSRQYLGLGIGGIESFLSGNRSDWGAFILKPFFTAVTLSFGGSGGIITPVFFTGAAAGNLFGSVFGLDIATFAALGFVAVLAGAANTPIAASIMAIELFGPGIASYAAIACVVSFLVTGHRSVYPSQILAFRKSKLVDVKLGDEMEMIKPKVKFPDKRH